MPARLRLDPWATEYGSALQLDDEEDDAALPNVDCSVELACAEWRPIVPEPSRRPEPIAFVDGVQRLDARVTLEQEGETVFGALASVAVGAVRADTASATLVEPLEVHRTLALAGPAAVEPIQVPCGSASLQFAPSFPPPGTDSWRDAIDRLRRDLELRVGQRLADAAPALVVLDGRLRLRPAPSTPVVGYTKTLHRQYLSGDCRVVLPQLRARERCPLFRIDEEVPLFSWYLRLSEPRAIDHSLAGIVRLETVAAIGRDQAIQLANQTTQYLPDFASPPERDPRAPQNLLPIGGLEAQLRHAMGDPTWVRRAIEQYLYREAA